MLDGTRLSLRRLFAWMTLYAILLGTLASLPLHPLQQLAALFTLPVFMMIDSQCRWRREGVSTSAYTAINIAFAATAFAAVAWVCYVLYILLPSPPAPPTPKLTLLQGIFHFTSGQFARDLSTALSRVAKTILAHLVTIGAFSAIALAAAILARHDYRSAKWIALANAPGTILLFVIAATCLLEAV